MRWEYGMADEVVGSVTVNVHGDTTPLKNDIRRAAAEAGKTLDDSIGKGAAGTAITDNIVDQVADAEAPAGREGQKVGRAIVRGVETGTSRIDLRSRITTQLRDIEAPLRATGERIRESLSESIGVNEAPLRATGARLNRALSEAMGGLTSTGSAIGREWDKRLDNIDYRIARAIQVGPRKAAIEAARDMGTAWDKALTRVDDRIGRMSFAPFREKIAAFGQMWDETLTRMDDRVGAMSFTPILDEVHEIGDEWDETLTRMDDRVGRFDPLATFRGIAAKWDATLTRMDDRVGRFDPAVTFRNIASRWDEALTRMDDRVGRFDPAVTFRTALAKISDAAQKFNPPLTGVTTWKEKFRATLADDRGSVAIGGWVGSRMGDGIFAGLGAKLRSLRPSFARAGGEAGKSTADGMKKSMLQAGIEGAFMAIAAKAALMGPAIAFGIRAAVPVITGLIGQIAVLGTALGGIGAVGAASMATLIPGIGALKIAFAGLDAEAKKALTAKFTGAMGDLAGFKERVRNEITPALVDALETVSKLAPEINKLGIAAADAGGKVANAFAEMLVGRQDEIGRIFGNSSKVMERLGTVGAGAVDVIINALDALQPLVMRTVGAIERGMAGLTESLNRGIDNGTFLATMEEWYARGKTLLSIFKNLGIVIGNFLGAGADASDDFLTSFDRLTERWAEWTSSIEGESTIKKMFDDAVPVINEVWGLLGDIAGLFKESFTADTGGLVEFVQTIRTSVIPGIERFQTMLRDSGIQDSLYDLANAVLRVFESGGGTSVRVFLETLTVIVDVIADLTDALGPVLVPLATFYGMFKALTIAKTAFSGLLALPAMLTGLVSPAKNAAGAVGALNTQATATAAVAGAGTAAKVSRFAGAMTVLGSAFNIAAVGALAFIGIPKLFASDIPDSTERVNEFTEALVGGKDAMDLLGDTEIPRGFMNTMDLFPEKLTGLEEIINDFNQGWSSSFNRWGADFGVDVAGIEDSRAAFDDIVTSIERYADVTGDVQGAKEQLGELELTLKHNGAAWDEWGPKVESAKTHLDDLAASARVAGLISGVDFLGDFSTKTSALETVGKAFDDNITKKIDDIKGNPKYKDILTGGLNAAGIEQIAKVYKNANLDMINGFDNAISETDANRIRAILTDKGAFNQYGEWTQETMEKIAAILPGAIKRNAAAVKKIQTDYATAVEGIMPKKGLAFDQQQFAVGGAALRLYIPEEEREGIDATVRRMFGQKIIDLRAQLTSDHPDWGAAEINAELQRQSFNILVDAQTEKAETTLRAWLGQTNWQQDAEIWPILAQEKYIEVEGQLLGLTEDGEWEAIVGVEADTVRAHERIVTLTEGPGGWGVDIYATAHTGDAEDDLNTAARNRTVRITAIFEEAEAGNKFLYYNPATGEYEVGGARRMVEEAPVVSPGTPSVISPGGPTTMGYGSSLGPVAFGVATRAGIPLGGDQVVGRPNFKGDKEKDPKNVTINNYYPEPERVSDTIAMQMRLARYA